MCRGHWWQVWKRGHDWWVEVTYSMNGRPTVQRTPLWASQMLLALMPENKVTVYCRRCGSPGEGRDRGMEEV